MRAFSVLAVAALMAMDSSAASAQSTRHFTDSWFWGVKGGVLAYQVQSSVNQFDPEGDALAILGGVDWLITRKKGGLYVSFDHSLVRNDTVFVNDSITPLDTVPRAVALSGMRRFTLAGMLFPLESNWFHPYVGFGASLSSIATAEPQGTYSGRTQENLVLATITQFKTVASPLFILGAQMRLVKFSVFGQVSASPTYNNFFLFTGQGWRTTLEGGLRYNIGSSIDRMR
jgi:hypothetical protein